MSVFKECVTRYQHIARPRENSQEWRRFVTKVTHESETHTKTITFHAFKVSKFFSVLNRIDITVNKSRLCI